MTFWELDCPERGPALRHYHVPGPDCDLSSPYAGGSHEDCPCSHCNMTPTTFAAVVDPDSLPLALPQPHKANCLYQHAVIARIGEIRTCPGCNVPLEPKMATGKLEGPVWGIGRGWINPRTRRKWEAIAHRFAGQFG